MLNIPDSPYPRIVIIGAGFGGFTLAKKLAGKKFQVILIDKHNYHQFQPLFYQVAMAGLEPSSIVYPLRKAFQRKKNVYIRVANVNSCDTENKKLHTDLGTIYYDKLVIATGATTNFFGNSNFEKNTFTLKSLSQSLMLRNAILADLENALMTPEFDQRQGYIDIVIVGGGPTGVELAGALAEMKHYILPKDYKELDKAEVDIYLIQGGDQLLQGMAPSSGAAAKKALENLGVHVMLGQRVVDFDGHYVKTKAGEQIRANKVIWAAGVKGKGIDGLPDNIYTRSHRIKVDRLHAAEGLLDVYAIGDVAFMREDNYPDGHPQVAQPAIQQASNLAYNLIKSKKRPFTYKDLGSMATIGRNKAVAEIGRFHLKGFMAWALWLFVHLTSLIGFKNKFFVLVNWIWSYLTYDQSLRVIIRNDMKSMHEDKR